MSEEKQIVETESEVKGKLVMSFTKPTPIWATWVFRTVFLLTTALSVWVLATGLIQDNYKNEIMLGLKVLDVIVWGIGRSIGIDKSQFENN